jgi:hypothetical protein
VEKMPRCRREGNIEGETYRGSACATARLAPGALDGLLQAREKRVVLCSKV